MHHSNAMFIATAIGVFACVIFILVVLHELGHYLTARAFGLKPRVFSVGFGPEVAGFTNSNGTRWKLSLIPLGGYVSFHGRMHPDPDGEPDTHPESFARLARWKRTLIILAGPVTNLVVCAVMLMLLFAVYGEMRTGTTIDRIAPGGAAAMAGILPGDRIVSFDGSTSDDGRDFTDHVRMNPGSKVDVVIERNGRMSTHRLDIAVAKMGDRFGNVTRMGRIGMALHQTPVRTLGPVRTVAAGVEGTARLVRMQVTGIWQMIVGRRSIQEISGPIRMAKFSGEQFLTGWPALFAFMATLSSGLAITNLMIIPGLDGGYLAMYAVETLRRKNLSRREFGYATAGGMLCIAAFTALGVTNDVLSLM